MLPARKNRSTRPFRHRQGFTLAEVMIAAAISVIAMIGLLGTTILSYKYALMARYKERATNALLTIADQFQNAPVRDHNQASFTFKTLFKTTSGDATGTGMAWNRSAQCFVYPNDTYAEGANTSAGLTVPLNTVSDTTTTPYYAHVTRIVSQYTDPYPEAGTTANTADGDPDPMMLEGIFKAEYPFDENGNKITSFLGDQTVSIKVLRTITKTDRNQ